jgi:hypothetical protein
MGDPGNGLLGGHLLENATMNDMNNLPLHGLRAIFRLGRQDVEREFSLFLALPSGLFWFPLLVCERSKESAATSLKSLSRNVREYLT